MSKEQKETQSMGTVTEYRFTGNAYGLETRIPVHVTEARVENDKRGNPFVVAQVLMGVASNPVEVTMTIEQALEADIIEGVE